MHSLHIPLGTGAEFDLIRRFLDTDETHRTRSLPEHVRVGAGDDCAIVRGEGIALSVDMAVEGVHFRREWLEPEEIGYRSVAAALSDLAATAATPVGVLIALAINDEDGPQVAERIMEGARAAATGFRASILGGDITRSTGPLVMDVVVVGNAVRPALRRGAKAGDNVWVTGELGAAAVAVAAWKQSREPEPAARLAFALPTPRIAEASWLMARNVVHAMIDISDGLAGDIAHIAAASGVRVTLDARAIPIHPVVCVDEDDPAAMVRTALTGGEDYEICFTSPPGVVERFLESFQQTFGLQLTCVGTVQNGEGVALRGFDGRVNDMDLAGFDHFARTAE